MTQETNKYSQLRSKHYILCKLNRIIVGRFTNPQVMEINYLHLLAQQLNLS